jgi:hypothetical protein
MAVIGNEIVRVDSMVEDAGQILMTIGRGCVDTVPQAHPSGSTVLFIGLGQPIEADYVDGEAVGVRHEGCWSGGVVGVRAAEQGWRRKVSALGVALKVAN